jgi:hypothetical protein
MINCDTNIDLDLPDGSIITNRIEVVTFLLPDGEDDYMVAAKSSSGNNESVPMVTAFGMLEMAKACLLSNEDGDDDDDEPDN